MHVTTYLCQNKLLLLLFTYLGYLILLRMSTFTYTFYVIQRKIYFNTTNFSTNHYLLTFVLRHLIYGGEIGKKTGVRNFNRSITIQYFPEHIKAPKKDVPEYVHFLA